MKSFITLAMLPVILIVAMALGNLALNGPNENQPVYTPDCDQALIEVVAGGTPALNDCTQVQLTQLVTELRQTVATAEKFPAANAYWARQRQQALEQIAYVESFRDGQAIVDRRNPPR